MKETMKISKPDGSKRPVKENIFRMGQIANAQLTPLFPYSGPGDIVPCCAVMKSYGQDYGHFHHFNTVDEVAVVFGTNAQVFRTGEVHVGAREHGVQGPPKEYPGAYVLFCITQRQLDDGERQYEALSFMCEKCGNELHRHEFEDDQPYLVPILPTVRGSAEAALGYKTGLCNKCGHDNPLFPESQWGWSNQVKRTEVVSDAMQECKQEAAR